MAVLYFLYYSVSLRGRHLSSHIIAKCIILSDLQDVPQNQCKITNFQAHGQIFSALFPLFERVDLVLAVLYVSHRRRIQVVYSYV